MYQMGLAQYANMIGMDTVGQMACFRGYRVLWLSEETMVLPG